MAEKFFEPKQKIIIGDSKGIIDVFSVVLDSREKLVVQDAKGNQSTFVYRNGGWRHVIKGLGLGEEDYINTRGDSPYRIIVFEVPLPASFTA